MKNLPVIFLALGKAMYKGNQWASDQGKKATNWHYDGEVIFHMKNNWN